MPQLRVYRSFIKKAADSGKYLIIWDEKRRYEGQFKGFDPQGEFVILVDVKIRDESEEIESPEILIPIENIKIVSTETEEEHKKRRLQKTEVRTGILMPGVSLESVETVSVPKPDELKEVSVEEPLQVSLEEKKPEEKTEKLPEKALEEVKPIELEKPQEPLEKPELKEVPAEEAKSLPVEEDLVSVIEKDVDTSVLSQETKELIERLSKKELETEQGVQIEKAKPEIVEEKLEETSPVVEQVAEIERVDAGKEEIVIPKPQLEVNQTKKQAEAPLQKPAPQIEKTVEAPKSVESKQEVQKKATAVIEEKSKKAAASPLFKESKVKKPEIPKRRVDIGTLILDIIIVILSIVAIGILAVTLFNIKLPFF